MRFLTKRTYGLMIARAGIFSLLLTAALLASCAGVQPKQQDTTTLTIIGLNDVHGELQSKPGRGGLTGLSGFIDATRAARAADRGAVLVIDAGDMWQGTLESNLGEGAAVVEAYNAIGITAAAVGNHEFDFGPVGAKATPSSPSDDPRGALRQRALEANFPLLAANIIEIETGRPVAWDNVQPSTIVDVEGINVGIIGVLSDSGLRTTISANTVGLALAPLAATITDEARKLRASGATVVIVTAHAGSRCTEFNNPDDLSSCHLDGEIMRVAAALPKGLVDHIVAGHVHQGIAHVVNGVSITSSYSSTRNFSRVDLTIEGGYVASKKLYPPQQACLYVVDATGACAKATDDPGNVRVASYEGRVVTPNPAVAEIARRAAAAAETKKMEKLGVYLASDFPHPPATESPLANLMTDAILQSVDGDIAIHNVVGGIRNTLPEGDLTFGSVYEMFPFDNRVVVLDLSGAELRAVLAHQAHNHRRRAGVAGIRASISCNSDTMKIVARRVDGRVIGDDDRVRLIANDFLVLGGDDILTPVIPDEGFAIDDSMPLVRDVLVNWFKNGPTTLRPEDFSSDAAPRWDVPASLPGDCRP